MSWWPICRRRRLPRLGTRLRDAVHACVPISFSPRRAAFGDTGPYRDRGGFDGVGQAMSGAMYITGVPGRAGQGSRALRRLHHRGAGRLRHARRAHAPAAPRGEGQEVKTTLLGTALAVFSSHLIEQSVTGINRAGSGNRVQTSAPSDVFATTDGHVLTPRGRRCAVPALGATDGRGAAWVYDPRYATDQSRGDHSAAILARMRAWCATRTTARRVAQLNARRLPAGPVLTPQQALDDPQVAAMKFLKSVADYPGLCTPGAGVRPAGELRAAVTEASRVPPPTCRRAQTARFSRTRLCGWPRSPL